MRLLFSRAIGGGFRAIIGGGRKTKGAKGIGVLLFLAWLAFKAFTRGGVDGNP